jgi:predicted  nucleic acid-binding Zn-ribbon protein
MFGKTRDIHDSDTLDSSAIDEFFGDEAAAEQSVEIHDLRDRVVQVESQINSQFTSLATYAQIAQEQVELARAEARAATERSEQRLTSLIERERADRITSYTGVAPDGSPDITARLDALEHSVARIQKGLDESRRQQRELATAITAMFDRLGAANANAAVDEVATPAEQVVAPPPPPATPFAPPTPAPNVDVPAQADDGDGPITGLALDR